MTLVLIVLKIRITPHLVTVLLRLEVLSLSTLFAGICLAFRSRLVSSFVLAFFTMIVCEACIGLGVLVISSRSQGSDKILSLYQNRAQLKPSCTGFIRLNSKYIHRKSTSTSNPDHGCLTSRGGSSTKYKHAHTYFYIHTYIYIYIYIYLI